MERILVSLDAGLLTTYAEISQFLVDLDGIH
jgi:hypothetical protein